jgi:GTPase
MTTTNRPEGQLVHIERPRPVIAIIGRANAGKSTLFNRLIGRQKAIVHDMPGVTRDRNYEATKFKRTTYTLVDTGGFELFDDAVMPEFVRGQALKAIEDADGVIFLVDGRQPLTMVEEHMAAIIREAKKPYVLAVNKIDGPRWEADSYDFYRLGLDPLFTISGEHGVNVEAMLTNLFKQLPPFDKPAATDAAKAPAPDKTPKRPIANIDPPDRMAIAIVGKPNVGKSTILNALLGEERAIVSPIAGTTRDAIDCPIDYHGRALTLVDTAGMRRKKNVTEETEVFSVKRTLRAIDRSHVVILIVAADDPVSDQDAKIANYAIEQGKCLILAANKWDIVKDEVSIKAFREAVYERLEFAQFAPFLSVSGLTGQRIHSLLDEAIKVFDASRVLVTNKQLSNLLHELQAKHTAPMVNHRPVKLYFGAQTGVSPPVFALKSNHPEQIPEAYARFLTRGIRDAFGYVGTPIVLKFEDKHAGQER